MTSVWDPDAEALDEVRNPDPYDYPGAKRAIAAASRRGFEHEQAFVAAVRAAAAAERAYKLGKAGAIVRYRAEYPATVAVELAAGDEAVSDLRYERDVKRGVADALEHGLYRINANRRGLDQLIDWSARVAPDGQFEQTRRRPS